MAARKRSTAVGGGAVGAVDVVADPYRDLTQRARDGDLHAAREILRQFVTAAREGSAPHQIILDYLADCFDALLADTPADEALNVKKPIGRPDENLTDTRVGYARQVQRLRDSGLTREAAIAQTARSVHKSAAAVAKAYDEFRAHAELLERLANRSGNQAEPLKRETTDAVARSTSRATTRRGRK